LTSSLDMTQATKPGQPPKNGDWQWHDTCPHNIIPQHEMYRDYM
jgi:hypothetical protein